MKTLSILLHFVMILFLAHTDAVACSLNPTAKILTDPEGTVFYHGNAVVLDGSTSTANCGSIDQYRWQIDDVTVSWSSVYSHTFSLATGESERVFKVQLRVRNTAGKYGYKTIYVTVTRNNKSLYYLTDHLGSVRVTVNEQGDPVGWDDYYPFGLQMPGRTQNASNPNDDQKFTGYELEQQGDLGIYHAGARLYDPVIGRFTSQDRFKEKYPSMSPYQYAANNPVNFIDVNGDSVDVSQLTAEQQQTLIGDLASITGYDPVQFEVSNGMLVINTSAEASDGTVLEFAPPVGGSEKARTFVNAMIGFSPTEHQLGSNFVLTAGQKSTEDGTLLFNRPNANNVDPAAWNVGMSFIHEAWHFARGFVFGSNTYSSLQNSFGAVGGIDPQRGTQSFRRGDTGPTVDFVNQIRSELGLNQRASYRGFQIGNTAYVPFDQASIRSLLRGLVPANSSSYFYK